MYTWLYMVLQEERTTIRITSEVHQKLLSLKIHPRESFNDVIIRLMGETKEVTK